jgi:hypothetical protein
LSQVSEATIDLILARHSELAPTAQTPIMARADIDQSRDLEKRITVFLCLIEQQVFPDEGATA